ncbi:MAG: glycine cleavage system aminomethyltransferase GcvT [Bacteroidota bacterium]|jgi:aminomethyltransferase
MKRTPFYDIHVALGAKMVPFAGYDMPVQYSGITEEHNAVRQAAGMFDVSHMGEFILKGPHALDLVQKISSNDAALLTDGKVQYSCMPNDNGGIVDDLLVYRLDAETYMLVVNASNIEKDWNWISRHNEWGVEMKDISDRTALLAVQGPDAARLLQKLTTEDLNAISYYTFRRGTFAGVNNVIISATGYTGAGGFELYFDEQHASSIWNAIMEAGKPYGLMPAGLGCRDTLRLEMGFCLYGNDIDDTTSPIEAGLGWITKFTKDFVNRAAIEEHKKNGTARKLVGFKMLERGIPRHDYPITDASGAVIGKVSSGTQSPTLKEAIGMGYVASAYSKAGSEIFIDIRGKAIKAEVVKIPFLKS